MRQVVARKGAPLCLGILDSGVGGLTVYDTVAERLPGCDIVYCCDNANFPYGPRSEAEILSIVENAALKLMAAHPLDCLIVACNTASTHCLPRLREIIPIPVVGVVPAIKPAALLSKSDVIGLLATPTTAASVYTKDLINQFAGGKRVVTVGDATLAGMAEEKLRGRAADLDAIANILSPFFDDSQGRIDHVVLGCTHFPLLVDEFLKVSKWPITWVDSSSAIANRVWTLVHDQAAVTQGKGRRYFYFTAMDAAAESLVPYLKAAGFLIETLAGS